MKAANLFKAALSTVVMLLVAHGVMAQGIRQTVPKGKEQPRSKNAVVVIRKDDKLTFPMEKARMVAYAQKALDKTNKGEMVKDLTILTLERGSFLGVQIEKKGTVFFALVASDGGIQSIFHLDPDAIYCNSSTCTSCNLSYAGGQGPKCLCDGALPGITGAECKLYPSRSYLQLASNIEQAILAAEDLNDTPTTGGTKAEKVTNPRKKN